MNGIRFILLVCTLSRAPVSESAANQDDPALEVLEKNCIECHNAHDKKGDVILDRSPLAVDDLDLIVEAVSGDDPEMPPKRDPLSADEISALRRWVESGAKIPDGRVLQDSRIADRKWWSLRPLKKPDVPDLTGYRLRPDRVQSRTVQGTVTPLTQKGQSDAGMKSMKEWARNEIDHFVLQKLQEKGLSPTPAADPRTLIRRLTFDLTGLPPTPGEIRAFVADSEHNADAAYRELVDRLLASPRYGEQWARHWLDVARYGESHGYDKDKARFNAWPYRDYVIRSFNEDKPWTRFVQEQVAGDVLWPDDPDGVIALGFVAAGPWDFIAHIEVGEGKMDGRVAKHLDRDDMVSAVFNAFMSTTVQCAQCHNHKFDPVSMEDYYRLHAVFAGVDRSDRVYDLDPDIVKKRIDLENRISDLGGKLRDLEKEIDTEGGEPLKAARDLVAKLETAEGAKLKPVPEHGYHSKIVPNQDEEKWVQLELPDVTEMATIRLIGSHDNYAGIGAGFGFPLRYRVEMADDPGFKQNVRLVADHTSRDFVNPGVTPVTIPGGKGKYIRVTATKLVERKNDYIFALAEIELLDTEGKNLARGVKVTARDSIEAPSRWGKKNLVDGKYTTGGDPEALAKLSKAREKLTTILGKLGTPGRIAEREKLKKQQTVAKASLSKLPPGKMVYTLATRFKPRSNFKPTEGKTRKIHLLHRGDLGSPGDEMAPGAPTLWEGTSPKFALETQHTEGQRRAALARYLTSPDNPLLWRSAANRIWLGHFGRGIVDSPNDFGRMGMAPTHPALLDWMAVRFRETESVKDLHRLIVLSSTYLQSSADDPDKTTIDGSNEYYWRMNRRKLRAEEMRDSVLSVAGVLDLKMGGPSFQDFKFKDDHTPKYWYHLHEPTNPDTHRRTIYRFIARSQTQPFLTILDCADPSQMVAKRDETTTALQALALMNNPFMTAMSETFAKRAKTVDEAVRLSIGRNPTPEEKRILTNYADTHGLPATARLLFNLNEFAYVD